MVRGTPSRRTWHRPPPGRRPPTPITNPTFERLGCRKPEEWKEKKCATSVNRKTATREHSSAPVPEEKVNDMITVSMAINQSDNRSPLIASLTGSAGQSIWLIHVLREALLISASSFGHLAVLHGIGNRATGRTGNDAGLCHSSG